MTDAIATATATAILYPPSFVQSEDRVSHTRDALRRRPYWTEQINRYTSDIEAHTAMLDRRMVSASYLTQYLLELSYSHLWMLMRKYSRGDSIAQLTRHFDCALDYWEAGERLADQEWAPDQIEGHRTWALNLNRYIECFWFVGLALALDIGEAQWQRLLVLVGNEGEDGLLDSVIASRQKNRAIGRSFCYPQPYGRLWEAATAPRSYRSACLSQFLDVWYPGLHSAVHCARQSQASDVKQPYWIGLHLRGDGMYFGYWCIEAVATAIAFKLNDGMCTGHPNYPGDLMRPVLVTPPDLQRLPAGLF